MLRPKRRKKTRSKPTSVISCESHLQWVRGHECVIIDQHECWGRVRAHHVKSKGAGGGDEQVVPMCDGAHDEVHNGKQTFEEKYSVDLKETANYLAFLSPHKKKWLFCANRYGR